MSEPAQTVGERLKAAREAAGMSTQKAADVLRLDPCVVEALESGDYARLGPSVYGKGHMKRYAALLGLPADEIVGAAYAPVPSPAAVAAPEQRTQSSALTLRLRASDSVPRSAWVGIGALAIIALGVAVPYLRRAWTPSATPPPSALPAAGGSAQGGINENEPRVVDAGSPTAGEAAPASPSPTTIPGARGAAGTAASAAGDGYAISGVGKAKLRLRFSADSWVYVRDAEGRRLFAGNGRANSVTTIAGDAPMKVYLGFASGVQLELNNRVVAIGTQFIAGDVARFEAGADGVLRRDGHAVTANNPHPRG